MMKNITNTLVALLVTYFASGQNWQPQVSGTTEVLTSVIFNGSATDFEVGENGAILKTCNGGGAGIHGTG